MAANGKRPNILVIFGDDIGMWNLSCYSSGMMGYRTPNIDRIAEGGVRLTDCYGEQSCTAGRAAFITGQSGVRTGLTKVGGPGDPIGLPADAPTVAELLKPLGYATGQFGKNHFGDRNEFLPTVHGFDEFYGSLYPLSADDESEQADGRGAAAGRPDGNGVGRRGVIRSRAIDDDDPTEDPHFGKVGRQTVEDTGPLDRARLQTCDDEYVAAAKDFIRRQNAAKKPFFCWFNPTQMHVRTNTKLGSLGQAGRWQSPYHDRMIDHDKIVGEILDLLEQLGITNDTIVLYTTDNGPHAHAWPNGPMTPFRTEMGTSWEGAFRVPALLRWPGKIEPGTVSNDIVSHLDWLPTLLAAAGDPRVKEKLLKGHHAAGKTFRVHLDGFNLMAHLTGKDRKNPREGFLYFDGEGDLLAIRFDNWKLIFMEQRDPDVSRSSDDPCVPLRIPKLFNLRIDPLERADTSSSAYTEWCESKGYMISAAQRLASRFLETFRDFPPRQQAASFTLEQVMHKMDHSLTTTAGVDRA